MTIDTTQEFKNIVHQKFTALEDVKSLTEKGLTRKEQIVLIQLCSDTPK